MITNIQKISFTILNDTELSNKSLVNHEVIIMRLLGHVLERMRQALLAKGQFADSPNFGILMNTFQYVDLL